MTDVIDWQRKNGWLRALDTAIEQVQKRSTDLEDFAETYKAELKAAVDKLTNIKLGDVPQPAFVPVPIEPAPESGLAAPPVFPTSRVQLPGAPQRPQFMDVDSALGNLPQFPDVPVFGGMYIPPVPTMGQHALPARPQVDDVVLPDEPSLVLPTMGQLKEITIPDAPKLAIEDFTAVAPVADALAVPEVLLNWKEPEYKSEVLPDLVEWVKRYMQGGTGLPAPVEDALFGRARDRLTAETNVAVQEAVESWAARGFTMPPGMLAAQADAIRAKAQLQAAELNRDIMVEAAKWEIENIRFAVQQGMALEQLLQNLFENMAKRLFEAARFQAQAQIDVFNARVSLFNAQLQAYNTAAQVYKTKVEATLSRVQLFKAQVDAAIAQGQLNEQAVEVFKAQITAVPPVADALAVPEVLLNWKEPEYKSEVLPDLVEWVKRYMQGGTGLPAPVEDALFGRARDRLTAETNVAVQEAVESWAARGFTMPPGMLAAQADAIRAKAQLQAAELNRDIMVEAAKWEIENIRFAVQQGMALEQLLQNMFENMAKRLFEAARFHAQAQIDVFNARVSLFNAQLQAYNTAAQVYKTKVDATLSRVQLFKAQVDAAIAQGQLNEQAVSVFKAQITAVQAQAEIFATKMRGAQTKADVVKAKIDAYRADVQAFAELVGAEKVKFDAYSSQISGEKAKADAFDSLARAHAATISGIAAQADLKVKQVQLHIENNRNHATIYGADTERYRAEVDASLSQVKEQLAAFQAEASAWESSERVKVANAQMKQSYNESVMRTNIANAEMQLKQFEVNMQQAYQKAQIALEGAKAAGQYAAQLAAGAMSALHVSASVSGSGSQSSSSSDSRSESESKSTSHNYNY